MNPYIESFSVERHRIIKKKWIRPTERTLHMTFTEKTTIGEIVYQYSELIETMHDIGLYCFS
ncbi:MAG TPA: hypothetical protein VGD14_18350 [bacterium]